MLIRSGAMEIPTTTVALDLLSRTGYATRYSVSPNKGRGSRSGDANVQEIRSEGLLVNLMRSKDDFAFDQKDVVYSVAERDYDTMDISDFIDKYGCDSPNGVDDVQHYSPGDVAPPDYVRRFEEGIPDEKIDNFIAHVLSNIKNNDNGIKKYRSQLDTAMYSKSADDPDELVCMNDLQSEKLSRLDDKVESLRKDQKEKLAYCLYRFNILSTRLHVNILSMLIAHKKAKRTSKSTLINKPAELIENGTYYADVNGDCTVLITKASDKSLTSARRLLANCRDADIVEFKGDVETFDELLGILNIDIDAEDPTLYTHEIIMKVSRSIMVNNYDYVSRKHGGYNREILNSLKTMSLDDSVSQVIEETIDMEEVILDVIESSPNVLRYQLDAINKTYTDATELAYNIIVALNSSDGNIRSTCGMPTSTVGPYGFIMSTTNSTYTLDSTNLVPKVYRQETSGLAYFHASGYVMFFPRYEALLMCTIEDYLKALQFNGVCKNIYIIGQQQ